jgi:hypothetical protein
MLETVKRYRHGQMRVSKGDYNHIKRALVKTAKTGEAIRFPFGCNVASVKIVMLRYAKSRGFKLHTRTTDEGTLAWYSAQAPSVPENTQ